MRGRKHAIWGRPNRIPVGTLVRIEFGEIPTGAAQHRPPWDQCIALEAEGDKQRFARKLPPDVRELSWRLIIGTFLVAVVVVALLGWLARRWQVRKKFVGGRT